MRNRSTINNDYGAISHETWFKYFENLFKGHTENTNNNIYNFHERESESGWLDNEISDDEILSSISALKNNCAPGVDGLCTEMFKCTKHIILPYLN